MARHVKVSPQDIEQAALDIVRTGGISALTARGVADALGVSTQPVYSSWGSMDALKERVEQRVTDFIRDYLSAPEPEGPPMLSLGLRTVRLAIEEPQLFALAATWMRHQLTAPPPPPVLAALRTDPRLAEATVEQLIEVNALLWIITQGLAALIHPDGSITSVAEAQRYLTVAGDAVIAHLSPRLNT